MRNIKFLALIGLMFGVSAMCHAAKEKPIEKEKETIVLIGGDFASFHDSLVMSIQKVGEPFVITRVGLEKHSELVPGVPIGSLANEYFFYPESHTKCFIPDPAPDIVKQYNYTRDLRKDNTIKLHPKARLKM